MGNHFMNAYYNIYSYFPTLSGSTTDVQIVGNNFSETGYGILAESSETWVTGIHTSSHFLISNNVFTRLESAIAFYSSGYSTSSWSNNFTISSNHFLHTSARLRYSVNTAIINNTFDRAELRINGSNPGALVSGNKFLNWSGLAFDEPAYGITIEKNVFSYWGIQLWGYTHSWIPSNIITPDNTVMGKPIYFFHDTSYVNVTGIPIGQLIIVNVLSVNISKVSIGSTCAAIFLANVKDAVIQRSNITENQIGIRLEDVEKTLIHHNNFINNVVHVSVTPTPSGITYYLAYPFGGNYWSNYNGSDIRSGVSQNLTSSDGFIDAPYIGQNVSDAYPLTLPYSNMLPLAIVHISPSSGDLGTLFQMDASASVDLEDPGNLLQVRWDFDGDGIWDTDWSTNKTIDHRYSAPGQYELHFQVKDTSGGIGNYTSSIVIGGGEIPQSILPIVVITVTGALSLLGLGYSLMKVRQSNLRKANLEGHQNAQNTFQRDPSGGSGLHVIKGSRGGGVKP
jgi:hypothetical protein